MTAVPAIAPIVEGDGDRKAVPELLRRISNEVYGVGVSIHPPWRLPRSQMTDTSQLKRAMLVTRERLLTSPGGILLIADADDDCPIELASRIHRAADGLPLEITVAVREFEAWFLSSVGALRGHRAIRNDACYSGDPEERRDAKGELGAQMTEKYRETIHQVAFASIMDIDSAMGVRSFQHLVGCVGRLIGSSPPPPLGRRATGS